MAFGIGFIMTLFGVLIPHIGSAAKVIMAVYSAVTGPFSGLIMLALMFPWVNNKQHLWERLESVQRRATRIICGTADGSYDARLVWVPLVGDPPREATGLTDARTVPDARWTAFRDLVVLRSADKQKNWAA
ncbi:hypothetical protein ISCGN_013584 [Ixodes scapularis]